MYATCDNLFANLRRWAIGQDENFITEALGYLLRQLLAKEPEAAVEILQRITNGKLQVTTDKLDSVNIRTQLTTEAGTLVYCP